ncbi:MAG: regulator [Marinilabiliales bacterium]|nr:MAG: regulator [Marinilabiliales bacterium]
MTKIAVIEDDIYFQEILKYHILKNPDNEIKLYTKGNEFIKDNSYIPDIITLDYKLPDNNELELYKKLKKANPHTPIIIISGQSDVSVAVELLSNGAYDYIIKNEHLGNRLWNSLRNATTEIQNLKEIEKLKSEINKNAKLHTTFTGNSQQIKEVTRLISKAINTNITVSLYGETGTGKELAAKAIHYNSIRKNNPFIVVNLSAIPKDLIESELFGHEKGAFTSAIKSRIGKFEEANTGTLFLDEIGEIDLNIQTKLLRVIQEKEFSRIGSNKIIKTDIRLITATNKNMKEEVEKGNFREDLFYRLQGFPINMPPLRQRGLDTIYLAKHFLNEFCSENNLSSLNISAEAKNKLLSYHYPGNVRELKTIIEYAATITDSNTITDKEIIFRDNSKSCDLCSKELTLDEYNAKLIENYIKKYNSITIAAKKLDIARSKIYRYKAKYKF